MLILSRDNRFYQFNAFTVLAPYQILKQVDLASEDENVLDEIELNPVISDQVKQIIKFDKKLYESLILDFMEIYRYLIDDIVIEFSQSLSVKYFMVKDEVLSRRRKGKRVYLNDEKTRLFNDELDSLFASKVDIPLIRHGKRQRLETLINEEALLLAKYLRNETESWIPRCACTSSLDKVLR